VTDQGQPTGANPREGTEPTREVHVSGESKSANEFGEMRGKFGEWAHVARTAGPRGDGTCWIERRPALATVLAVLGIAVGLALLIVPGLFAIRSYRRWRTLGLTPEIAWNLGLLGIWAVIAVLIWSWGVYVVAILVPLPGWLFSMSAIRR
jgi:hypothetical protein